MLFPKNLSVEKSKGDPFGQTGDVALVYNVENLKKIFSKNFTVPKNEGQFIFATTLFDKIVNFASRGREC